MEEQFLALEAYTYSELRTMTTAILNQADENGAVYIAKYPRHQNQGRLYKLVAMGPYKMDRRHEKDEPRPELVVTDGTPHRA